ncbi:STR8 [Symbiodinium sp. CCMP2592]|nr:STR8 [Symbiodinium sp. CCMP2592]
MIYVPFLHVLCFACLGFAERPAPAKLSLLQHTLKLEDTRDSVGSSGDQIYSLFVKFHKVAGSTWRAYIDGISHEENSCSKDCGNPDWDCEQRYPHDAARFEWCGQHPGKNESCSGIAHSCTFHTSMAVIRQAVSGQDITTLTSDLADVQNLWPSSERLKLLWRVEWARSWLPSDLYQKRLIVTTILREPIERLRSYYYFGGNGFLPNLTVEHADVGNRAASHQGFKSWLKFRRDFITGNWSYEQFLQQASGKDAGSTSRFMLLRSCCEYETWLGDGSVERAKLALATQFDLVGITERLDEGLVSLGKLYGQTPQQLAAVFRSIPEIFDNSDNKLDWTAEEKALATIVADKSTAIYNFAQEVFQRRAVTLFGSEENMLAAVETFKKLNPDS